jgi:hypothetical protein
MTDITVSASAASTTNADQQLILKQSTNTGTCASTLTTLYTPYNPVNGGVAKQLTTPNKLAADTQLCFIDAVTGSKSVAVEGYIAP